MDTSEKGATAMTKEQLIHEILHDGVSRSPEDHDVYSRALWAAPVEHLQLVVAKKKAQAELAESEVKYQQHQAERAADHAIRQIRAAQEAAPRIAAQREEDYRAFAEFAKATRLVSVSEANFDILIRKVGSPFDRYAAEQAVLAGQVAVSRPTPSELEAWDEEAREQRLDFLQNHASREQLRAAAAQESVDARRSAQQQQIEYQLVLEHEKDRRNNPYLQPLPNEITAQAIKDSSLEQMKVWMKRFGNAALTARLHGIRRASATLDRGTGRGPEVVSYNFE
jgi:hypothetical protein